MLTPAQVIPFLQHDDRDLRKHAADYLIESHDPSPATCDDLWAAIDRFGINDALVMVRALAALPQTEQSYQRLIAALRSANNVDVADHLRNAAEELDFGLLARHRDEVLACEHIKPEVRDHLRQRLELADVPVDQLWDRLMREGHEAGNKNVGQFDHRVSWRLIQALSPHMHFAGERALAVLRDPAVEDWREIFCVDLVGLAKYRPAVDALIEKYLLDADVLRESVGDALMRLGDDEVVAKLEAFVPGKEWDVRLYALNAFERIKLPASEAALIRLIPGEPSPDLSTGMAAGLCMLCTTEGLDLIRQLILSETYDPQMADLPEMLLTAGRMVGYEPPEAEQWRRRIAEDNDRRARMFPDMASLFGNVLGAPTAGGVAGEIRLGGAQPNLTAPLRRAVAPPPPPRASLSVARPGPSPVRTAPKVGRNDPCPCGSGKKYKKCHGQ